LSVLLLLILGKEFGNRGHQVNARLLFGWLSEIAVGQLIGCNKGGYLTQHTAHSVTRKMKRCNTSSPRVFSRQFWFSILQPLGLDTRAPNRRDTSLADWWKKAWRKIPKQQKKGFNSLIILGAWILWKHRNACVFEGSTPNLQRALQEFKDERHLWLLAGAKRLAALGEGRVDAH